MSVNPNNQPMIFVNFSQGFISGDRSDLFVPSPYSNLSIDSVTGVKFVKDSNTQTQKELIDQQFLRSDVRKLFTASSHGDSLIENISEIFLN